VVIQSCGGTGQLQRCRAVPGAQDEALAREFTRAFHLSNGHVGSGE
jgi:hypothetical protein